VADRRLLGSLAGTPDLDRWVSIGADGTIVVRSGKVELGQGIRTALTAIAADELGVHPDRITVTGAATGEAPNEGVTAGSGSIEQSGLAVRQACAHARAQLVQRAARRLGVPVEELTVEDGVVTATPPPLDARSAGSTTPKRAQDGGGSSMTFAELAAEGPFGFTVEEPADPIAIDQRRWTGVGIPRVDLPAKVRGEPSFVHDLRLPGMRHARVIRPPRPGATLVDPGLAPSLPDRVDVVQRGSFLAVVADREADAVRGADFAARYSTWEGGGALPSDLDDPARLRAHVRSSTAIVGGFAVVEDPPPPLAHDGAAWVVEARYTKPFVLHGSIGPSAAVAHVDGDRLHVWSHSQGVELLRYSLAEALDLDPEHLTVRHVDGAGCYGHNGADDAAMDAATIALALPGTPIALAWSRADEHGHEPQSPAMVIDLSAGLDATNRITSWRHDTFSYPHGARPRPTGNPSVSGLLATWSFDPPATFPEPSPPSGFHSGAHRNADPLYVFAGDRRVVSHLVDGPVRTSSTRGLGAFGNVFAIESLMDELAHAAGVDPIAFRLAPLEDERGRAVVEAVVDLAGGLTAPGGLDAPGRGFAFSRYENMKAYVAMIVEVEVVARTGEIRLTRAWIAADAGEVIDPDGLINQLEGGLVQAASWTLRERVEQGPDGVTSLDWDSYPILRFSDVPQIETRLIDRPGRRSLGAGEATTGPTPAAIANAVFQATGARLRDLPFRSHVVKSALAQLL
jgi:CO/xanthine dehydrogenase Mo-binding subunit